MEIRMPAPVHCLVSERGHQGELEVPQREGELGTLGHERGQVMLILWAGAGGRDQRKVPCG